MSARAARRRNRAAPVATPADASDDDSDDGGRPITESSPLRRPAEDEEVPRRRARRRGGAAPAPVAETVERQQTSEESGASDVEAGAPSASSPIREAGPPRTARGRLRGLFGGGSKAKSESSGEEDAAASDPEPADGDGDPAETPAAAAGRSASSSEPQLALGLTERVQPQFIDDKKRAEIERDMYRTPRADPLSVLSRRMAGEPQLYAQPISERNDGLHVEPMPSLPQRSLHLLAARLGDGFEPPSKAPRLSDGTIVREPDPVRHVRVRPSHPGMRTDVETSRPHASLNLVDAATRSSDAQHTLQVSIGLVQLHDHPLFLEEHSLQRRLRTLAEELGEMHQRDAVHMLRRRVVELRRQLEPHLERSNDASAGSAEDDARSAPRVPTPPPPRGCPPRIVLGHSCPLFHRPAGRTQHAALAPAL
jgi:hypothetical protein